MRFQASGKVLLLAIVLPRALGSAASAPRAIQPGEEVQITNGEIGPYGGRAVASLHSDPKTLNPVTAVDLPSKDIIPLLFSDLIHIDLAIQHTEPALAKSWKVSRDGKTYTLDLRRGIRFSDGHPFDADDVVFSFKVYLDERVHSPQRDLLEVGGKPIQVRKLGPYQVAFDLAQPYAAAERIFDNVSILPRHLLRRAYERGKITEAWGMAASPGEIAGLGPFRLKEYAPGQQIIFERNPYYWKADSRKNRLPYLDEIALLIVPTEDAEVIRFQAGDIDLISKISPENYAVLERNQKNQGYHVYDLGPGLEYNFLFFNLNDLSSKHIPEITRKQEWFRRVEFRRAVSAAIDRDGIVRLVYQGRATPLWGHVTPGNKLWVDPALPHPPRSLARAADSLHAAGFSRGADGIWADARGERLEFSILTNPSNAQRTKIATIIQDDLTQLGLRVHLVPLEFQGLMARVFESYDYEACVLALLSGDADPNPEINVWTSDGGTHVYALSETHPLAPWQAELDRLMHLQTAILDEKKRRQTYNRVQEIIAEDLPVICVVSPNILVAAKDSVGGLRPSVMRTYLLWNAEQLFRRAAGTGKR